MADESITISPGPPFRTARLLAILADLLQIVVFPLFAEGAASPADDAMDLVLELALRDEFQKPEKRVALSGAHLPARLSSAAIRAWINCSRYFLPLAVRWRRIALPDLAFCSDKSPSRTMDLMARCTTVRSKPSCVAI